MTHATRACILITTTAITSSSFAVRAQGQAAAPAITVGSRVGESSTDYNDGGRRDPFMSLIAPKAAPAQPSAAAPPRAIAGLAGLSVNDATVKGLMRSGDTLIALLQGPDGRTYMAKRQDRLQDGVIARIDADAVVFTARVPDAAGVVRTRDIRKPLRAAVSGGQQ